MAHGLLFVAGNVPDSWVHNWNGDILFISLSLCGVAILGLWIKVNAADLDFQMRGWSAFFLALTIVLLALTALLYGSIANGNSVPATFWAALALMALSALCSLYFDLAVAATIAESKAAKIADAKAAEIAEAGAASPTERQAPSNPHD